MTKMTYKTYRAIRGGVIEIQGCKVTLEQDDIVHLPPGVGVKYINLGYLTPIDPKPIKIQGPYKAQEQKSYKVG